MSLTLTITSPKKVEKFDSVCLELTCQSFLGSLLITIFASLTCLHFAIEGGRSIQDQALDLQELVWLVASHNSETKPPATLFQLGVDECPLQLGAVPGEERLPS